MRPPVLRIELDELVVDGRIRPGEHRSRATEYRHGERPSPATEIKRGQHLSPATEFRAGREAHNRLPVGSVRVRIETHTRLPRAWVKVAAPNVWKKRAVVVWEAANGPLPRGSVVHHVDGDSLNDHLSNLRGLTRAEHTEAHRRQLVAAHARKLGLGGAS